MTGEHEGDGVPSNMGGIAAKRPRPASVRYNDWRQVTVAPLETFTPVMPVSVIIPYYQTPAETLERTLAALEGQTWPRDLCEVVIVDDGSEPPLPRPRSTPLDVKVVRQERRGFGLARARNTGARAAAHDILLFLDSDLLAETDWIAAHARWHHVVSDALTVGFRTHVAVDGLDAETIRCWPGSLRELLADRPEQPAERFRVEAFMRRTDDLTSRADNLFRMFPGGNCGVGREFYESVGGNDESFTRWGGEDTEFAYRAYTRGGLLVPLRDAFAWNQGLDEENRDAKDRSIRHQRGKLANLIAHPEFRGNKPGRTFAVPRYTVTIEAERLPADPIKRATARILADRVHDLVVRIDLHGSDDGERLAQLREEFGPDPRVRVGPARSALDEFPATPFHVTLPAGAVFAKDLVHRLHTGLGDAVTAVAVLPDGFRASITRARALHRVRRAGGSRGPADFGEARTLSAATLKLAAAAPPEAADFLSPWDRFRDQVRDIRGVAEAGPFLKWLAGVAWWQMARRVYVASAYLRHRIWRAWKRWS